MLTHKGTKTIQTARLTLRKFTVSDAESMYRNYANDGKVTKFLSWKPYACAADVVPYLERVVTEYADDCYHWAIVYENEVIGSIAAITVSDKNENCELGYAIGYDYWGKGITTEAAAAVICYLFYEVGMHRIMAKHDVENPASGGVMKKCGMCFEGRLRDYYKRHDGTWSDALVYGILCKEWAAMQSK